MEKYVNSCTQELGELIAYHWSKKSQEICDKYKDPEIIKINLNALYQNLLINE